MSKLPSQRVYTVDFMRFVAILLMVIFHFIYDLKFFGYVSWDTPDGEGWRQFRQVILTLFFLCVGFSLAVVHGSGFKAKHFVQRLTWLILAAIAVTISSLIMAADNWIFFGVLHFIAVASVLTAIFASLPNVALVLGLIVIAIYNLGWVSSFFPFHPIAHMLSSYTNDYVGLFPWTGVVLIGVWLAYQAWFTRDMAKHIGNRPLISFASRHSLIIYLVHQPILFAIFGAVGILS
ncbi:heparan-alpha-glucosaminide N-acetyltransferase [Aliiglaciecola sp. LCG003]|uniref:DUF1624 domain-containing protein n=1 Tax=Aliiglaciecola sp. LCG003 TaxID=3053655 RepID=UPI00257425C6|nr:heparan-alpha-glucosaminide N-acetyltransferase [Aliiglaciecola sp. LCG003]WJG08828.1 heparan-alpha-glucosaminide N-acetyltransferase [Aliiglaciecola sp. LCG003]